MARPAHRVDGLRPEVARCEQGGVGPAGRETRM
jgi:hypothetical protein